jgi:aryl-alcohol dehydrogenase-like predicted oxidoreductase
VKFQTIANCDKAVSRLVCGCDRLGFQGPTHLDAAYARGINAFETARLYRGSEAVLGEWIARRRLRNEVFVTTKGGFPTKDRSVAPDRILTELDVSLRELRTDHVDLYLLHYDPVDAHAEEVARLLEAIITSGRARLTGVANFALDRVRAIHASLGDRARTAIAAISAQLSLPVPNAPMWPALGSVSLGGPAGVEAREWFSAQRVAVLAYSVLGRGFFTAALRSFEPASAPSRPAALRGMHGDLAWLDALWRSSENTERLRRATALGAARGASAAQIGIAYVLSSNANAFAVAGWNSEERLLENAAAVDLDLSREELDWLELHPREISVVAD